MSEVSETLPHVLWICDRSSEAGGVACSLVDLFPFLRETGCAIEFAAPINASFPGIESIGARVWKVLPAYPDSTGYIWSLKSFLPLLRLARKIRPTVVVADHTNGLWLIMILRFLRFPAKIVYRNHGVEFLLQRPWLARLVSRFTDVIVTDSRPEADSLAEVTLRKIETVSNCIPDYCLRAKPLPVGDVQPSGPVIAHVGWLTPAKGINDFARLVRQIRASVPGLRGIAMGGVHGNDSILQQLSDAGIECKGAVRRDRIFEGIDFLAVCSRRESFGLTLLEAPFYDVLPVAFESPGTRFILGEGSPLLVPLGQVDRMEATILRFWEAPREKALLCAQLRETFLQRFDPRIISQQLASLLGDDESSAESAPTSGRYQN